MTRPQRPLARAALLVTLSVGLPASIGACASTQVRPWDRDLLAEKKMAFVPDPILHAVDEHIYFSREASTGGADVGGGGCGCN
jgi:hypothetical protein